MLCPIVLAVLYGKTYKAPAQGSVVVEAFRVFKTLFANSSWSQIFRGGDAFWNNAKPSHMAAGGAELSPEVFWDDLFVEELRASCSASVVFFLTPIFILADGAIGNQYNDMSVAMKLGGIPNDIMNNVSVARGADRVVQYVDTDFSSTPSLSLLPPPSSRGACTPSSSALACPSSP